MSRARNRKVELKVVESAALSSLARFIVDIDSIKYCRKNVSRNRSLKTT